MVFNPAGTALRRHPVSLHTTPTLNLLMLSFVCADSIKTNRAKNNLAGFAATMEN
jgi:hypothetical protein